MSKIFQLRFQEENGCLKLIDIDAQLHFCVFDLDGRSELVAKLFAQIISPTEIAGHLSDLLVVGGELRKLHYMLSRFLLVYQIGNVVFGLVDALGCILANRCQDNRVLLMLLEKDVDLKVSYDAVFYLLCHLFAVGSILEWVG